jgi:hypothetical protein
MSTLMDELRSLGLVKTIGFHNRESGERESRDVVLYDGLLHAAKQVGLVSIQTQLVQAPTETNGWIAIAHARVETKAGVFTGIGDANPENVNARIRPHFIRVAETRSKARALRDAVDLKGVVCFEELEEEERETEAPRQPQARGVNRIAAATRGNGKNGHATPTTSGVSTPPPARYGNGRSDEKPMSDRQRRFLFRLLAERGLEGDQATQELCRLFQTRDLARVTSAQASALIDQISGSTNGKAAHARH